MNPRLFPLQEALEWLAIADRDLRLAELAVADQPPLTGEALYHAQQAAEKALKGFLVFSGVAYPLTHDVRKLLQLCGEIAPDLASALMSSAGLTQFAVRFRYLGEDQPTRDEALPWIAMAKSVCSQVALRLK